MFRKKIKNFQMHNSFVASTHFVEILMQRHRMVHDHEVGRGEIKRFKKRF